MASGVYLILWIVCCTISSISQSLYRILFQFVSWIDEGTCDQCFFRINNDGNYFILMVCICYNNSCNWAIGYGKNS